MLVLGGRAPGFRWGQGSLQEIDHVPFVAPLTKLARTAGATADIHGLIDVVPKGIVWCDGFYPDADSEYRQVLGH